MHIISKQRSLSIGVLIRRAAACRVTVNTSGILRHHHFLEDIRILDVIRQWVDDGIMRVLGVFDRLGLGSGSLHDLLLFEAILIQILLVLFHILMLSLFLLKFFLSFKF